MRVKQDGTGVDFQCHFVVILNFNSKCPVFISGAAFQQCNQIGRAHV